MPVYHSESLLKEGAAKDHQEVARWGGVTRSRISQILNLRNLAPAIQEQLLFEQAGQQDFSGGYFVRRCHDQISLCRFFVPYTSSMP